MAQPVGPLPSWLQEVPCVGVTGLVVAAKDSVRLYLAGTAKGQRLDGHSTTLWATSYDGSWCIHAVRAVVS